MKKSIPALLIIFILLMTGCSQDGTVVRPENGYVNQQTSEDNIGMANGNSISDPSDLFSSRDFEAGYDESSGTVILLDGDTITSNSDAAKVSGRTVTITDEGTYILSGTLNDGMIIVNADITDEIQLVFNNVSVHCETSAPVYILNADKVFITLARDSVNNLSNGGTFTPLDENNIDAVIFSKDDLTLNGSGLLNINSPAGHGIVSKNELKLTGGAYQINAASHGLEGRDNICIANAEINIIAGKDGIDAENGDDNSLGFVYIQSGTFAIASDGDGISSSARMQIDDGTFNVATCGGSAKMEETKDSRGITGVGSREGTPADSANTGTKNETISSKGIKATGNLTINGGTFTLDTLDDAFHSNSSITVNNGTFHISTGDDAFHADENLTISDGTVDVTKSYEGLEALNVVVCGGDLTIYSNDDGINAAGGKDQNRFGGIRGNDRFGRPGPDSSSSNGSIVIAGGKLYINARGDGIDANGTLSISDGYTVVCGPATGDTAMLDFDISGTITGGTFIGTGSANMAQNFSDSGQGIISVRLGTQPAGTAITLTDSGGNTVIPTYTPELDFDVVILSSPDIVKGGTYTITVGSTTGQFTAK